MGVEDGGVEMWGVLKSPTDLPLNGQCFTPSTAGPLDGWYFCCFFVFCFFVLVLVSPKEVRFLDSDSRQGKLLGEV